MKKNKLVGGFIIGTFVMLYILVSLISTIHVIDFFELSNPRGMAIALAVAFEVGAAASLASLITLDKMNKTLVWALFIAITAMQMQGNMYYAFMNLGDYQTWSELFNLIEEEPLFQKRILAFVSGAILPLVALGFIKSLVDYIKPEGEMKEEAIKSPGKQSDPSEEVFDWDRFVEEDSEEALLDENMEELHEDLFGEEPFVKEDFVTDELLNQEFDNDDILNYQEMKSNDREKFVEEFDEDHALDRVMNTMVEDLEEEDLVDPGYMVEEKPKDAIDLVNSKEANQDKMPKKDLDASYKFGKNLYQTMVKKANTDHLQVDSKPSKEEITQAYRNLGLVNKRK